jgi:hypothetical protein
MPGFFLATPSSAIGGVEAGGEGAVFATGREEDERDDKAAKSSLFMPSSSASSSSCALGFGAGFTALLVAPGTAPGEVACWKFEFEGLAR